MHHPTEQENPVPTTPHTAGPDGEDVTVTDDDVTAAAELLPSVLGQPVDVVRDELAQALANIKARGARAGYEDGHSDGFQDAARRAERATDDVALTLTHAELARIRDALAATPGAPVNMLSAGLRRLPIDTGNRLATILEELRDNAAVMRADRERMGAELRQWREDRDAVRRWLGQALLGTLLVTAEEVPTAEDLADEVTTRLESRLNMALGTDTRLLIAAIIRPALQSAAAAVPLQPGSGRVPTGVNNRRDADRDALIDLLGAINQAQQRGTSAPVDVLAAADRARRHLDRVAADGPQN